MEEGGGGEVFFFEGLLLLLVVGSCGLFFALQPGVVLNGGIGGPLLLLSVSFSEDMMSVGFFLIDPSICLIVCLLTWAMARSCFYSIVNKMTVFCCTMTVVVGFYNSVSDCRPACGWWFTFLAL